jgi:hypothetical protein
VAEFGRSGFTFPDEAVPDVRADSERELVTREEAAQVRSILSQMSPKTHRLLSAVFLKAHPHEEGYKQFKEELGRAWKVSGGQLRAYAEAVAMTTEVSSELLVAQQTSSRLQWPGSRDREAVITRAIEVIGDEQEARRWLGTPVRALDYATPISRLNGHEGQTAVLNVLTQLEHGVL